MKKSILVFASLILFIFAGVAAAADKIGFVDVNEVMNNSEAGKKANDEFKKTLERNRLVIQGTETDLQKMKNEIDNARKSKLFTEDAMKGKEAVYEKKFGEYQVLVREANGEIQTKRQEFSKSMYAEIEKILNSIGDKEKYTAILDVSSGVIPYYSKASEVTKRVMEEFNKSYKPKTK
jgi:outer membrane protein